MERINKNGISYYKVNSFDRLGLQNGFFTRKGGVSPYPWESLNFGGTVGDDAKRVERNHDLAFKPFGFSKEDIFDVWQVHGANVIVAGKPRRFDEPHQKADIILTNKSNLVLFMRFADCVPIILFDPVNYAVGMIHAGWLGTINEASVAAVDAMRSTFASKPKDLFAVIGPSIGPDHYEVGEEVINQVHKKYSLESDQFLIKRNEKIYLDLWKLNSYQLQISGVESIENPKICTACNPTDWYSHRHDLGKTGRFGVFTRLKA